MKTVGRWWLFRPRCVSPQTVQARISTGNLLIVKPRTFVARALFIAKVKIPITSFAIAQAPGPTGACHYSKNAFMQPSYKAHRSAQINLFLQQVTFRYCAIGDYSVEPASTCTR